MGSEAVAPVPVVNELLCFVSNRVDNTPQDIITKICSDFYPKAEIEQAKTLLHTLCNEKLTQINDSRRNIRRQGANKAQADMKDILEWVSDLGSDLPCFAAVNLAKLPTVGTQHVNLAAIVADIADIKSQMASLRAPVSQPDLPSPPVMHSESDSVTLAADGHESHDTDATTPKTVVTVLNPSCTPAPSADNLEPEHEHAHRQPNETMTGEPASAASAAAPPSQTTSFADLVAGSADSDFLPASSHNSRRQNWRNAASSASSSASSAGSQLESSHPPNRRSNKRPVSIRESGIEGNGSYYNSLQAARPSTSLNSPGPGGLFVTQLRPGTNFKEVRDHIFRQTGMRLKCLAIRSRNEHRYASFRVLCDAHELQQLLRPALWPKGCFVKKFDERL